MVITVLASSTLRFIRLRLAQVLSSKRFISLQRLCMCATPSYPLCGDRVLGVSGT